MVKSSYRDNQPSAKPVYWMGWSLRDLKAFPDEVMYVIGTSLRTVQRQMTPGNAKMLKGFGADVLEIVDRYDTDTYRLVYTVRFRKAIYVLHAFMKKAKRGIETPRSDIELVKSRLQSAKRDYEQRYSDEAR